MNSIAVGITPAPVMIFGTVAMACSAVSNSASRSTDAFGSGSSLSVMREKIPSVPSEPTSNWIRLYPVTSLSSLPPSSTISPVGVTTSRPTTYRPVTPYLIAFPPPAFSATLPPM